MRFRYKRPRMNDIDEELDTLFEVMLSDVFIYLDLLFISFIFTLLLSPVLASLSMSLLFFIVSYTTFCGLFVFVVKKVKLLK